MKTALLALGALFLWVGHASSLEAQTVAPVTPPPGSGGAANPLGFLTHDQQMQYAKARAKALADNPQLKQEGIELIGQQDHMMTDTDPADQQAYIEKMRMHRQKMREAMLKEDPTIQPIFDAIDKRLSEMRAKQSN